MEVLQFDVSTIDQYSDDELGKLFFPEMYESENIYLAVDYDYVHKELSKPGVNLKLLWKEYCLSAKDGKYPVSYSKYCRGYAQHVERHNYTNHIEHKPGIRTEIDWSGPTMHYMVPSTGELVKVYLFVASLPFSQYSYVEPTKDMKIIHGLTVINICLNASVVQLSELYVTILKQVLSVILKKEKSFSQICILIFGTFS